MTDEKTDVVENIPDEIVVAEGSEFERTIRLSLPRGKQARGLTPAIAESISGLEILSDEDGNFGVSDLGKALDKMLTTKDFISKLVPLAWGLMNPKTGQMSNKDQEWLDNLTDIEIFQGYLPAALYIATNGNMAQQAEAAAKK